MSELIRQFGIDWRLLIAQAINFSILFFLLYRFAYHPILSVLAERKRKIEEGMRMREDAERALGEAGKERDALIKKTEQESLAIIAEAERRGGERAEKIVADGMKKEDMLIREGKARAEEERRVAAEEFSREAASLVQAAVARVVEESPERIDATLVKKALGELRRVEGKMI